MNAQGRSVRTIRGEVRDRTFPQQRIVAKTSGGSDSHRLRGAPAYHEACNILQVPGSAHILAREAARTEVETAEALNILPPPPPVVATCEGTPAKGQGKDKDQAKGKGLGQLQFWQSRSDTLWPSASSSSWQSWPSEAWDDWWASRSDHGPEWRPASYSQESNPYSRKGWKRQISFMFT